MTIQGNGTYMGYADFLLGVPNTPRPTLNGAINSLQDASALFVTGYTRSNMEQAERATDIAMRAFDFIVGEIMRHRDLHKADGSYTNSAFEREMNVLMANMVSPVTRLEHEAVRAAGPNNGCLPTSLRPPTAISVEKTLNKIKHRHPDFANFRIQGDRHNFVICVDKVNGSGADSVVEFDVETFCDRCRKIAAAL